VADEATKSLVDLATAVAVDLLEKGARLVPSPSKTGPRWCQLPISPSPVPLDRAVVISLVSYVEAIMSEAQREAAEQERSEP